MRQTKSLSTCSDATIPLSLTIPNTLAALLQGSPISGGHAVPNGTVAATRFSEDNDTARTGASAGGVADCSTRAVESPCKPAVQKSAEMASAPHAAHPNGSSISAEEASVVGKRKRPLEQDTPGPIAAPLKDLEAGDIGNGESTRQEAGRTDLSRERGIAVAAAAFAEGTAQAGAVAVVDLKSPAWVLNVDVLPVGGRSICALCLVSADCVTIRPKLTMKQIGS